MQHLDEGTIHAWLDQALPADEAERVSQHVASCAECAASVADARGLIAGAARIVSSLDVVRGDVIPVKRPVPPASIWRTLRLTPARAALAATVMIAVASLIAVRHDSPDKMAIMDKVMRSPAPPPVVTPASTPAPLPSARIDSVADPAARRRSADAAPKPAAAPPVRRTVPELGPASYPAAAAPAAGASSANAIAPPSAAKVAEARSAPVDSTRRIDSAFSATIQRMRVLNEVAATRATAADSRAGAAGFATTTSAVAALEGCYRILTDSTAWLRFVPQRFALERNAESGQNVVRTVSAAGRIDSLVPGGDWTAVSGRIANVRFVATTERPQVALLFTANATRAVARSGTESRDLSLQRTDCRP